MYNERGAYCFRASRRYRKGSCLPLLGCGGSRLARSSHFDDCITFDELASLPLRSQSDASQRLR